MWSVKPGQPGLHPASGLLIAAASLGLFMAPDSCCSCVCGYAASTFGKQFGTLRFERNLGQADPAYQHLARARQVNIFLGASGAASLDLRGADQRSAGMIGVSYRGADRRLVVEAENQSAKSMAAPRVNYFFTSDPANWVTDVPTYARLTYHDLYPGIDLVYYGNAGELEHDFVVKPGVDASRIRMEFTGARRSRLREDGSILLEAAAGGQVTWHKPEIYQRVEGQNRRVEGRYRTNSDGTVGFELGVYDTKRNLVIDPVVTYSTYLGRGNPDVGTRIATDASGNIYMTGVSFDGQFPITPGAVTSSSPGGTQVGSAIITKLNAAGTAAVWSTYLGGINTDSGHGIAVDAGGNVYIAGGTDSPDYPTTAQAFQPKNNSRNLPNPGAADCFVTKINAAGNALVYSSFLGGTNVDTCTAIAVDAAGSAYVTGFTNSQNLAASSTAFQRNYRGGSGSARAIGESDAFVAKVSPDGASLAYLSYLGGSGDDAGVAIAVDASGSAYVTGVTNSQLGFPISASAFQPKLGGAGGQDLNLGDAFVTKVSPDGSAVTYSTYLGGLRDEVAMSIAVDPQGNAYVSGSTLSTNFPVTAQAYQREYKGSGGEAEWIAGDAFVTKLNPTGSALVWSTYLGGARDDRASGLALDSAGNVYLTGNTLSTDFPVSTDAATRTFQGFSASPDQFFTGDAFVAQLSASGSALLYSTYLGGSGNDWGLGIAVDPSGGIAVTGGTSSRNFPITAGAYQPELGGAPANFLPAGDAFVVKYGNQASGGGGPVSISSVSNAASYVGGSLSPGEIAVLTGVNIGPPDLLTAVLADPNTLSSNVGDTRILFDGVAAPIIYVSAVQSAAVVPYGVEARANTSVIVEYRGGRSAPVTVPVVAVKPALFSANGSGSGPGAILNQDNSYNTAANPAAAGSIVVLFGTGHGQTNPTGIDGRLAISVFPKMTRPVSAEIAGIVSNVVYSGGAPGLTAGVFQMNVVVPSNAPPGEQPVVVKIGDVASQTGLTVAVK